jgi:CrcB protein
MTEIKLYFYIAIGGASGACLRYFFSETLIKLLGKGFPFATLTVNILGSLLLGVFYGLLEKELIDDNTTRALVAVGLLGAFTTFSTFSLDTLLLLQQGHWLKAMLNVILNVCGCVFVAYLGMQLTMQKG